MSLNGLVNRVYYTQITSDQKLKIFHNKLGSGRKLIMYDAKFNVSVFKFFQMFEVSVKCLKYLLDYLK